MEGIGAAGMPSTQGLPAWPSTPPTAGRAALRPFLEADVPMLVELPTDPYVPLIGTLPARATEQQARDWIQRQHDRRTAGEGLSFAVVDRDTGTALGQAGLWLAGLAHGRATAGYSVAPSARGSGIGAEALIALTGHAWSIAGLHRVELYIEPWNAASIRTAERAGYAREGLLRSHQEIGGRRRDMLLFAALRPG